MSCKCIETVPGCLGDCRALTCIPRVVRWHSQISPCKIEFDADIDTDFDIDIKLDIDIDVEFNIDTGINITWGVEKFLVVYY